MGRVKYKNISDQFDDMVAPVISGDSGRTSVYSSSAEVVEHYLIDVNKLLPFKKQARKYFSESGLRELSDSIKSYGVRQPLSVVRSRDKEGFYEVVSGERRWRAAMIANQQKVPCIIISSYASAEEIALVENLQREDLHPIEAARSIKQLLNARNITQVQLAEKLGLSKQYITNLLSYTRIPEDVQIHLIENNIKTNSVLRKVLAADDPMALLKSGKNVLAQKNRSLLRISLVDNEVRYQTNGLKGLDLETLSRVRSEIDKIIADKMATCDGPEK